MHPFRLRRRDDAQGSTYSKASSLAETRTEASSPSTVLARLRRRRERAPKEPESAPLDTQQQTPVRRWSFPGFRPRRSHDAPGTPAPSVWELGPPSEHAHLAPGLPHVPVRWPQGGVPADVSSDDASVADVLGTCLDQRVATLQFLRRVVAGEEAYLYRATLSGAAFHAVHPRARLDAWAHANVRTGMALGALLELDSPAAVCDRVASVHDSARSTHIPFAVDVVLTLQTLLHVLEEVYHRLRTWFTEDAAQRASIVHTDEQLRPIIQRTAQELAGVARGLYIAELESSDRALSSGAVVWECITAGSIADVVSTALLPRARAAGSGAGSRPAATAGTLAFRQCGAPAPLFTEPHRK